MNVYVNNKQLEITNGQNIHAVLTSSAILSINGIAVAVNNNVIPKSDWGKFTLKENDQVTIIRATQGG